MPLINLKTYGIRDRKAEMNKMIAKEKKRLKDEEFSIKRVVQDVEEYPFTDKGKIRVFKIREAIIYYQ